MLLTAPLTTLPVVSLKPRALSPIVPGAASIGTVTIYVMPASIDTAGAVCIGKLDKTTIQVVSMTTISDVCASQLMLSPLVFENTMNPLNW